RPKWNYERVSGCRGEEVMPPHPFTPAPAHPFIGGLMSDDIARMLYEGAVAVKEGRHADAQGLLLQVIERDEQNELAWLWLSGAMEDPADQQVALENVLAINPSTPAARAGLSYLQSRYGNLAAPPAQSGEWTPPPPRDADEV